MNSRDYVYIWQRPDWPNWRFDLGMLAGPLAEVSRAQGILLGRLADVGIKSGPGMIRNEDGLLTGYVYEHGGKLQHYMIAKILEVMLGAKFCVDIDVGARGAQAYCWFEFVLPGQAQRPGEVWKWRKEVEPDDVHIYMSEKLARVLDQISAETIRQELIRSGLVFEGRRWVR